MSEEEVYGDDRSQRLEEQLREFARLIVELDGQEMLLSDPARLLRLLGDIRSELFHYEVRITYDSPEIARHRRLVDEAKGLSDSSFQSDPEDDEPWRRKNED